MSSGSSTLQGVHVHLPTSWSAKQLRIFLNVVFDKDYVLWFMAEPCWIVHFKLSVYSSLWIFKAIFLLQYVLHSYIYMATHGHMRLLHWFLETHLIKAKTYVFLWRSSLRRSSAEEYIRQQAHRTFHALDADGNGYIEQREFCMVVEALCGVLRVVLVICWEKTHTWWEWT